MRVAFFFLELLAKLPLSWLRFAGKCLGSVAYRFNPKRCHVTRTNLRIAFPDLDSNALEALVLRHFHLFGTALLDRVWLWFAPLSVVYQRLELVGFEHLPSTRDSAVQASQAQQNLLFVPHMVGLEAAGPAWIAACIARHLPPPRVSIVFQKPRSEFEVQLYRKGRGRYTELKQFTRPEGIRPVLKAMTQGHYFHCSPDNDFGLKDSVFAPFFGIPAATVTVLPRLANKPSSAIIPVVSQLTSTGYRVQVLPAMTGTEAGALKDQATEWTSACTAMNQALESWVKADPAQYMFSHRRYKTRPEGSVSVY